MIRDYALFGDHQAAPERRQPPVDAVAALLTH
jgi:hypothetical protein